MVKSKKTPSCSAVIAAAGLSKRMGGGDKLFIEIHGVPVLAHTLAAFQTCVQIDEIIIITRVECMRRVGDICEQFGISKASKIIIGGPTRLLSVINGVFAAVENAELIAIHDGARPCIDQGVIRGVIEAAAKYHAAAPAIPINSTVKRVKDDFIKGTVDRDSLFEIQTPQIFETSLIKAALTNANNKSIDITDDCMAVELIGAPVRITGGSRRNIKLTTSEDLAIAEAILRGNMN